MITLDTPIDCACVIHGTAYSWDYVQKLYNMLQRNITPGIRLHVYTEPGRAVPEPMIKHELQDWGISGARKSWWYKMQLFNPQHHAGPLLYFDLDVVVLKNIDWILGMNNNCFWALRDFKSLWRPSHQGINSSVMWWDTRKFESVWTGFKKHNLATVMKQYHGDQDYITHYLDQRLLRFFPEDRIQSWRWQCKDGGYDFKRRIYLQPGAGTILPRNTDILVFHGKPKPADINDPIVTEHWK